MDQNKLRETLKEMGIPDHLTCLLRNLYAGQETTVRTLCGTTDWFQIGKGVYIKAIYDHSAYLTYIQSASFKMLGWINHKLESRLPGEISTTSDVDDTTLTAESKEELKTLLMTMKEESEKTGLKLKITASGPITSWQIEGEKVETVTDSIFLGSKITEDGDCSQE